MATTSTCCHILLQLLIITCLLLSSVSSFRLPPPFPSFVRPPSVSSPLLHPNGRRAAFFSSPLLRSSSHICPPLFLSPADLPSSSIPSTSTTPIPPLRKGPSNLLGTPPPPPTLLPVGGPRSLVTVIKAANESFDSLLKRFRRGVFASGHLQALKHRTRFESNQAKRKRKVETRIAKMRLAKQFKTNVRYRV